MISNEFKQNLFKLKELAFADPSAINVPEAALLLLQFTRNRILYDNIVRKNMIPKLQYEAKKALEIHCARLGVNPESLLPDPDNDMILLEEKVKALPPIEQREHTKGIRPDHDTLPDEIRSLFDQNVNLFIRMRKIHEALKMMDNAKPCDRYPYVKEMIDLDNQVVANWEKYDKYVPGTTEKQSGEITYDPNAKLTIDAKRISANRKYISDNKDKLADYITENSEKTDALRDKIQGRLNELLLVNAGVSDSMLTELAKLGINV